ncbi:MAG: hypothetical protein WCW77_00560 [Patescibacteria group bacterium]|jgi:hypothetical protein
MFDPRQKQLIIKAVDGQIGSLKEIRHEVSNPPFSNRQNAKFASRKLIGKFNEEILENNRLLEYLKNNWEDACATF